MLVYLLSARLVTVRARRNGMGKKTTVYQKSMDKGNDVAMNVNERKKQWRSSILEQMKEMSNEQWERWNDQLLRQFYSQKIWTESNHLALYYAVNREVHTQKIMREAWASGKVVYLPKCVPDLKRLDFYRVDDERQLGGTFYGIPEPDPNRCEALSVDRLDLVLVPGLVFDRFGYRIGYGGGYYDRFLQNIGAGTPLLSLAYPFQITEEALPRESFDLPVDRLITIQGVIHCQANRMAERRGEES